MIEIVGVRFRRSGRICYLNPQKVKYEKGQIVVTETKKGHKFGNVVIANTKVDSDIDISSLDSILRAANPNELKKLRESQKKERYSFNIFQKKIEEHNLKMKLIRVEYVSSLNKYLFSYTAQNRIDFRGLVKDLASSLHGKIELRQIGVRDSARLLGGLGTCGKPFCCSEFLDDLHSVSIKMAKDQGINLNPTKVCGICGRLMCCLKFEQNSYDELIKIVPAVGSIVKTTEGVGKVVENNLLTGDLYVRLDDKPDCLSLCVKYQDVEVISAAEIDS